MKNKMETILGLFLVFILGFGGGAAGGVYFTKKMQNGELNAKIDLQRKEIIEANAKLDSLQNLPAKVDTVITIVKEIEHKTDTLILTSKKILDNSETIMTDVQQIKKAILNE